MSASSARRGNDVTTSQIFFYRNCAKNPGYGRSERIQGQDMILVVIPSTRSSYVGGF